MLSLMAGGLFWHFSGKIPSRRNFQETPKSENAARQNSPVSSDSGASKDSLPGNLSTKPPSRPSSTPEKVTSETLGDYASLEDLAGRFGVVLTGKNSGKNIREAGAVYLTPRAVYVGENQEVVRILRALGTPDSLTRAGALEDLIQLAVSEEENLESLFANILQNDENEDVRSQAARGLEGAKSPDSVDALIGALEDESETVRQDAVATLGEIGGPVVRYKLKECLKNSPSGQLSELATQILEEMLDEPLLMESEEEPDESLSPE
jgi:hypothetical protein